jgi:hypothetical protein
MLGDFNILLSSPDRSFQQKINKETSELNDTADQMDLRNTYRIFYKTATEYTFFSRKILQNRSYFRT